VTHPFDRIQAALRAGGEESSDFDLNPDVKLPPGRVLRPAAVLVAFHETDQGMNVLLTKRSSVLKHHPGQIAFPGGKVDDTDKNVFAAALREAEEEVALPGRLVDVLGSLPTHETVTGYSITPVLGMIRDSFRPVPSPGEVEEVFTVPFSHIADPERFQVQSRVWQGQKRYYYTVPFGPYYIWGATARILRSLAERMAR